MVKKLIYWGDGRVIKMVFGGMPSPRIPPQFEHCPVGEMGDFVIFLRNDRNHECAKEAVQLMDEDGSQQTKRFSLWVH